MKLGTCETCAVVKDENLYLREQNRILTEKLLNMADPALEARLAHAKRMAEAPPTQPSEPRPRISAQDLRRTRRDGPPPPVRSAAQVEESFRVKPS